MASVTLGAQTDVTTNAATYNSGAFTPALNDLLVAFVAVTGQTATDWAVTDNQSGTWTKVLRQVKNASADIMEVWVRNQLAPNASTTVTYSHVSGNATGGVVLVWRVAGITRTGSGAIRSQGGQDNQAASGTPAPVLNQAALTGNPTLTAVFNATNPSGVTAPASWTGETDVGFASPTTGWHGARRDSGFTGTTITWGSTSASAFASAAVEVDSSTAPVNVSGSGTIAAAKTSLISSANPSRAQTIAEASALVRSANPTGTGHVAEASSLVRSANPAGSEGIAETKALRLSQAPKGAESIAEASGIVRSAKPTATEGISQTKAVVASAKPSAAGHLAEASSLVVSSDAAVSGAGHVAEASALALSQAPRGSGAVAETPVVVRSAKPTATGGVHVSSSLSLVVQAAGAEGIRAGSLLGWDSGTWDQKLLWDATPPNLLVSANPRAAQGVAVSPTLAFSQAIQRAPTIHEASAIVRSARPPAAAALAEASALVVGAAPAGLRAIGMNRSTDAVALDRGTSIATGWDAGTWDGTLRWDVADTPLELSDGAGSPNLND